MDVLLKKILRTAILGLGCASPVHSAYAVNYFFPTAGGGTLAVAPLTLGAADNLTVDSGTFQTPSSDFTNFTVTLGIGSTITNNGTISYAGTDSVGKAINANRNDATGSTETITNNGTISSGTGLFAIYAANANAGATNTLTINNNGTITGGIFANGQGTINLNLNGAAQINGGITLTPEADNGISNFRVGNTSTCNFTTNGTFQDITNLIIDNNSTLTITQAASTIENITVNPGSTLNANATIGGIAAPDDGTITNSGTINIRANITKTDAFNTTATGNTQIFQAVSVSTSTYNNEGTHTAVLTDQLNVGNLNLTAAPDAGIDFNNFAVTYGNGYLNGGTYNLVTALNPIVTGPPVAYTIPSNTLFLAFNTPSVNSNQIRMAINRTPFQTFASNSMTQQIGTSLEMIGANPTSEMMPILNAIEQCTTAGCVEFALRQLAPLISAPTYGIQMQDQMINQVYLRLAALRNEGHYVAGDIAIQNAMWIRGYGDKANQQPAGDSLGYYASTGGTAIGFDRYVDTDLLLGVAFSYALSHVRDKINTASVTDIKTYQAMFYGSYDLDAHRYVNWMFAASANNYDGSRYITINSLQLNAKSQYSSQIYGVKAVWGGNYAKFDFLQVTPEASLLYTFAKQYEYSETQAMGANLQINRTNSNIVEGGLGGKLAIPIDLNPGICVPEIHAMGLYNIINGKQTSIASFLEGGTQISANMNLPRSGIRYGVAVTFAVLGKAEIKLNYDHTVMDRYTNNAFYLNFKYIL